MGSVSTKLPSTCLVPVKLTLLVGTNQTVLHPDPCREKSKPAQQKLKDI